MKRIPLVFAEVAVLLALCGSLEGAELRFPLAPKMPESQIPGSQLTAPVHLNADSLTYDDNTGVTEAKGNVELVIRNRTMRADRIRYDAWTGEADLEGKVRYKDPDEEFAFDRITINLGTETGILYNGTILIRSSRYLISSRKVEKTGKETFLIDKGSFTTCPCDPEPDWKFEVRRSRVTLDQYAYGRDITFRIRGVPVLWLPYGAFPVKLTRQSGLLLPNFSSSRSKGYTVEIPYYRVLNRWSDATLSVETMSRRGYRPELEYRFVLNPDSEGTIRGTWFHDKSVNRDRWRAYGENIFRSGRWTANAMLELPSDNVYYLDLVDQDNLRSGRDARSEGFVGSAGEETAQAISVTWNKDLQGIPGDNTVQRLPEYTATLLPRSVIFPGLDLSGVFSATNFYRREGIDEVRGRGFAQLSRTLFLYPSITMTPYLFADILETRFERSPGSREISGRFIPGGGAALSTDARRDYLFRGAGFVHAVGTSLGYRYVPKVGQEDLPVTDRWSRLAPQSQFVLATSQRFLEVKDGASPRELASLYVEWAYDVGGKDPSGSPYVDPLSPLVRSLRDQIDTGAGRTPRRESAVSDVYGKLSLTPPGRWTFQGEMLFDPVETNFTMGAVSSEWKKDHDNRVLAEYRVSRDLAEDVHGLIVWKPLRSVRLQTEANYSVRNRSLTDGSAGMSVFPKSDCWNIGFVVERKSQPTDTSVKLTFGLRGMGSMGN